MQSTDFRGTLLSVGDAVLFAHKGELQAGVVHSCSNSYGSVYCDKLKQHVHGVNLGLAAYKLNEEWMPA